jgi:predicted DNA-binding transcriptional regulator AlpA
MPISLKFKILIQKDSKLTAEFLTAEEIAPLFGVKSSWLLRHTRTQVAGTDCVPHIRIGKFIRFRVADLRAWFEQHKIAAAI